jgi:hypothetical protein
VSSPDDVRDGEYQADWTTEQFAAAWASKCEDLARETARTTALTQIIRDLCESSRPEATRADKAKAWKAAWAIVGIDDRRRGPANTARSDR